MSLFIFPLTSRVCLSVSKTVHFLLSKNILCFNFSIRTRSLLLKCFYKLPLQAIYSSYSFLDSFSTWSFYLCSNSHSFVAAC